MARRDTDELIVWEPYWEHEKLNDDSQLGPISEAPKGFRRHRTPIIAKLVCLEAKSASNKCSHSI